MKPQTTSHPVTGAVVMAAGQSKRMGQPKMILPWDKTTIIGNVVQTLARGGVAEIVVVTGGARQQVEEALEGFSANIVFNPDYANGEMLLSLQTGIRALSPQVDTALVVLGDQPQIEVAVVRQVIEAYQSSGSRLVVPSYQMRRGHPWLVERSLWAEVLALSGSQTLRDFLQKNASEIEYLLVDTPSVLMDMDTPEDYQKQRP